MSSGYCTGCGAALAQNVRFCTLCGTPASSLVDESSAALTHVESSAPVQETASPSRRGRRRWTVVAAIASLALLSAGAIAAAALRGSPGADAATAETEIVTVPETTTDVGKTTPTITSPTVEPRIRRAKLLGDSVRGRRIVALERGNPSAPKTILVVGCIHGDECAGVSVVKALKERRPPPDVRVWLIANLNPDGRALGTRQNANGVDLNRNSPYDWRALGSPGEREYSGAGPLSEPETRLITSFIERVRPDITFWFHQRASATWPPLIDDSGGRADIEASYARLVGLPFERKPRYPGSLASWSNWRFPGSTSFVIELAGKREMTRAEVRRHASAIYAVTKKL